jgi:hypothetical protein
VLRVIFHIARNTFRECLRHPIYIILLLSAMSIIGWYPWLSLFVFRQQEKMVTDGSLATILLFGLMTAVLCASHAIYREIETGTVLLVLAKPIGRGPFIIAKMLGIIAALTIFVFLTSIATLFSVRVAVDQFELDAWVWGCHWFGIVLACAVGAYRNFTKRITFPASTVKALVVIFSFLAVVVYWSPPYKYRIKWGEHVGYNWDLVAACVLVLFAVWAMCALATALSTQFNLLSNLSICLVIFMCGLISDYLHEKIVAMTAADSIRMMHSWFYILIPIGFGLWLLSLKHFSMRRQTRVRKWHINTIFGLSLVAIISRAFVNKVTHADARDPAAWMQIVGTGIYRIKETVADTIHAMLPNWQRFFMADALAAKESIPASYIACGAAYAVIFVTMLYLLALLLFAGKEVGTQSQG